MREGDRSAQLVKELRRYGWAHKVSDRFHSGIPDIIACVSGYFICIETKLDDNTPTKIQLLTLDDIRRAGGFAFVVSVKRNTWHVGSEQFNSAQETIAWILRQLPFSISEIASSLSKIKTITPSC